MVCDWVTSANGSSGKEGECDSSMPVVVVVVEVVVEQTRTDAKVGGAEKSSNGRLKAERRKIVPGLSPNAPLNLLV